jgi:hypothetical protein
MVAHADAVKATITMTIARIPCPPDDGMILQEGSEDNF